jgi:TetR/AcrR family transcriptional repressor of mexCD-oprJ operon
VLVATTSAGRTPRADARRNIAAILDAGEACLAEDPETSMAEIARRAGVGRVTLYGHFASRADLVDAVFGRVVAESRTVLDDIQTDGDPAEALRRLITSSWQLVHRFRSVLAAAERELSPAAVRGHHDQHLSRLGELIERGRGAGVFRTDVPTAWLVAVGMTLMHAAAGEVTAGRIDEKEAAHAVVESILAACLTPPDE